MTVYLDTSDLIKLYIREAGSDDIQALVDQADYVVTSVLAYPEVRATLARRRRKRLMTAAELTRVVAQFEADWARLVVLACGEPIAVEAGRLAEVHALRGADAVHLASFAVLAGRCDDQDLRFSSADTRLTTAARSLG